MAFELENSALMLTRMFKAMNSLRPKVGTSVHVIQEEFSISGDALIHKIEELMTQGYIHRIKIQNSEGYTLLAIPLARHKVNDNVSFFNVSEATSARVIAAMVAQPKIIVEWQVSCPI